MSVKSTRKGGSIENKARISVTKEEMEEKSDRDIDRDVIESQVQKEDYVQHEGSKIYSVLKCIYDAEVENRDQLIFIHKTLKIHSWMIMIFGVSIIFYGVTR